MIGFRDWQGRTEPTDDAIERTVGRLLADPNTEFLLGGEPSRGRLPAPLPALRLDRNRRLLPRGPLRRGATRAGRALAGSWWTRRSSVRASAGCTRMDLDANEANAPALALYRSVGFDSWSAAAGGNDLFMRLRL